MTHTDNSFQAKRSPEEEGDYLVFEQLVAEAALKKDKDEGKKKSKSHRHSRNLEDSKETKETKETKEAKDTKTKA